MKKYNDYEAQKKIFTKKAAQFVEGLISESELKAIKTNDTRIEVKPAVILLWNFGTKSYVATFRRY